MKFFEIRPFEDKHVEDAAKLFTQGYIIERKNLPFLPDCCRNFKTVMPLLYKLIEKSPGVGAIKNNKLIGFLVGQLLPSWRGRRSIYIPEWAHAAIGPQRKEIFQQMYTWLAAKWIANNCFTHLITVLEYDREVIETLFWFGFGMASVDAIRDFSAIHGPYADVDVRRAGLNDIDIVLSLSHEQQQYMAKSPIFMVPRLMESREGLEKWLSNSNNAIWLALYKKAIVSYVGIGPLDDDGIYVVTDSKTARATRAFTKEPLRRKKIASTLLKHALDWIGQKGFNRCYVDFEPENVLGSYFWLKHFKPVCFTLIRQVDARIAETQKES